MSERPAGLHRVAQLWGNTATQRKQSVIQGWADSPIVIDEIFNRRLQPQPTGRHWLTALTEEAAISRGGRWLSLGCGPASLEVLASREGLFESLLGLDASPTALAEAARIAAAASVRNLKFEIADLNALSLERNVFDVVLMNMSLHHVENLEATLDEIFAALKPGGAVIVNEFIGPTRFQFSDLQVAMADELLGALPPRYRVDVNTGALKERYLRYPISHWEKADPSEAVRSADLVRALESRFQVVLRRDYGGTLLHLVLEHIAHNFDPLRDVDVSLIRLLGLTEEFLIRNGVLASDFTLMILKKGVATGQGGPAPARPPGVEAEELRARIRHLVRELEDSRSELAAIKESRAWRVVQSLRGLIGRRW